MVNGSVVLRSMTCNDFGLHALAALDQMGASGAAPDPPPPPPPRLPTAASCCSARRSQAAHHARRRARRPSQARLDPLLPQRKSRAILYSEGLPLQEVPDTDEELLAFWSSVAEVARHADAAHTLAAAARLLHELAGRRVAFVRSGGRNLRVKLAPPFARFEYDPVDAEGQPL